MIREAVECGREEDGEADRWGWLPVGERALDGLARCVAGWWACASENAAGFRGWKRAGALRGWSERVRAGRGEAGAHAGQLRARRASACGLESAQERGSAGAGPAGPRAGEGRRVGLREEFGLGWVLGLGPLSFFLF